MATASHAHARNSSQAAASAQGHAAPPKHVQALKVKAGATLEASTSPQAASHRAAQPKQLPPPSSCTNQCLLARP
eukprot:5220609-Lingulodinium_polyedra.AAC.1